ncbi:MAG: hypothetical protein DRR06_12940 [Gammaproteobacteria bacterium]|nr:MAG: hypothetical protein DRR06_12940 [Gammaproteobacteria bacterium]
MIKRFFCLSSFILMFFVASNLAHARGGFGGFHGGGFHAGGFHAGGFHGGGFHGGGFRGGGFHAHAGGYRGYHYHPHVGYYHPLARAAVYGAAVGAASSYYAYDGYPCPYGPDGSPYCPY